MYNKLFAGILDSTIWLESQATRIVWITILAAMDDDGFVRFGSVHNVANRAQVSLEEAESAIQCLESPDSKSPGQDHDGRRIERVSGGFYVLNFKKYRDISKREEERARNRERKQRERDRKRNDHPCHAPSQDVIKSTSSETETTQKQSTVKTPKPPEPEEGGASPPGCSEGSPRSQSKSGREDRTTVKAAIRYPDVLSTDRFKAEFEDWVDHRMGLKKPGVRWSVFFQKQIDKELVDLGEQAAFEMVKNSTIQGYTGLFAKSQPNGRNRAPSEDEIDQTKF